MNLKNNFVIEKLKNNFKTKKVFWNRRKVQNYKTNFMAPF